MIYSNALISWSCSSPIENGDVGDRFFTASARSSITCREVSVEEETGTGKLCGDILIVFAT